MTGITVRRLHNELVAVKTADPDHPARRRAEAELLRRIDHPGVVELMAYSEEPPTELLTRYVGTDTWARTPPTTAEAAIAGLATVAATVADLHDLGTNHGSLIREHIVIGRDQQPVLCGLADARPLDPSTELDDLVGLAGLLRDVSAELAEPLRSELRDLARAASAAERTARELAHDLHALDAEPPATPTRRLPRALIATAATVAIAVLAALLWSRGSDAEASADPARATTVGTAAPTPVAVSPTPTTTTTTMPATPEAPLELVHEGRRYGLGTADDLVIIGDWNCDGVGTPALLEPATGRVAVFDEWPAPGGTIAPSATGTIATAIALEAVDRDGCDQLRILEPTGSRLFTPEP